MKLFGVFLKLIQQLSLTDSVEHQQLYNDVKAWELEHAKEDSTDKIGQLYYRIHKGVFARLLMPFLYFIILKEVKKLMDGSQPDDDF